MGLVKNFLLVVWVSILVNIYISGPERFAKKIRSYYEKPEVTIMPLKCVFTSCFSSTVACLMDTNCRKTIECVSECTEDEPMERIAACSYTCEMTHGYENPQFLDNVKCLVENNCLAEYPKDGICYGENKDAVPELTDLEQIKGDWWVIRGVNCGQSLEFPGGYDGYPCQHERFGKLNGQWINNVTYCDGKNDECISEPIITIANISIPHPGVLKVEYTDAPLSPQTEHWRIVSWPEQGDYMLNLWCGRLPIMDYNGVIVLSRHKNDKKMPEHVLKELKATSAKFGLSWDEMCVSNNDNCAATE